MGLFFCLLGFTASFLLGRRSLVAGLAAVLTVGYLYGILRANFLDTYSHFLFDAAALGFYASQLGARLDPITRARILPLRQWVLCLVGWPVVMFFLPVQHPLIQLVGLRGNAFLVLFLLFGRRLRAQDVGRLALVLAVLNTMALGFGGAEYVLGVERFYPRNPVTELIYRSKDVAGYSAMRIPATFANAHAYAGTMCITLPWLIGAWVLPGFSWRRRGLLGVGIVGAILGVLFSATRVPVVATFVLLLVTTFSGRLRGSQWVGWLLLLAGAGYLVSSEERLQRFLTLQDTDQVVDRIQGSINLNFLELLALYPMGNGLGGGGTSIPFFLQHLIVDPVGMENEYSRILLEQGLPGLILWLAFIVWALSRPALPRSDTWWLGWRLLWWSVLIGFGTATLGTGLMTSIPHTALLFLGVGFLSTYRGHGKPKSVGGTRTGPVRRPVTLWVEHARRPIALR